jgi:hypothetical protein
MTPRSSVTSPSQANDKRIQLRVKRTLGKSGNGSPLGPAFAHALASKDFDQAAAVLHPEIDFRALTPRRTWAPENRGEAVDVLRTWFGNCRIEQVVRLDSDGFADRQRVAYRFQGHRADGPFVIEQQVYFHERGGQTDWMRILCSGFRAP